MFIWDQKGLQSRGIYSSRNPNNVPIMNWRQGFFIRGREIITWVEVGISIGTDKLGYSLAIHGWLVILKNVLTSALWSGGLLSCWLSKQLFVRQCWFTQSQGYFVQFKHSKSSRSEEVQGSSSRMAALAPFQNGSTPANFSQSKYISQWLCSLW